MSLIMNCYISFILVNICLLIVVAPIQGWDSRKLDENTQPAEKCTSCNPSPPPPVPSPPPPFPSPPPPPTPVLCPPPPPPVQPQPTPKNPPSIYFPPPPPSNIYITGPPGELYPIVSDFNGASRSIGLWVLIGCGFLGFLVRFGL